MKEELQRISVILGIEVPKLEIVDDLPGTQMAAADVETNTIYLRCGLGKYDAIFALAHEMRHIWQVPEVDESRCELSVEDYNMLEEELDANAFAVAYMMVKHGMKPLFNGVGDDIRSEIYKKAEKMMCFK